MTALRDWMQLKVSTNTGSVYANEVTIALFEQLHDMMLRSLFDFILTVTKMRLCNLKF